NADHHRSNVIRSPLLVSLSHEALGHFPGRPSSKRKADLLRGQHVVETICANQKDVINPDRDATYFRLTRPLQSKRAGQLVPVKTPLSLGQIHAASAYLLVESVISGQLPQITLALEVDAAVSDMADDRDAVRD